MFRITRDPSSGSSIQCLAEITEMVLSHPLTWTSVLWQHICPWCVCVLHSLERHSRTISVILGKRCIELPDDGSFVIRNMLEQF